MLRHRFLFILFSLAVSSFILAQEKTQQLTTGDLLFLEGKNSSFNAAIKSATSNLDSFRFSHVGVAYQSEGEWFVIEAIEKGVSVTPLVHFIDRADTLKNGCAVVVVGRVKKSFKPYIKKSIDRLLAKVGKAYDNAFSPTNDQYYCSELVWSSFLDSDNKPIFESYPMSFKNKKTGKPDEFWIHHFKSLNIEIPEGVEGTNPADLSKSAQLNLLGLISQFSY